MKQTGILRAVLSLILSAVLVMPALLAVLPVQPVHAEENWTLITDADGLRAIGSTGNYRLMADITLTGNWTPLGEFDGRLDGNGKVIKALKIGTSSNNGGFFSSLGSAAQVHNLGFEDASVSALDNTGILAGANAGTVSCVYSTGSVSGANNVGGLVGSNTGSISDSYSSAIVAGTAHLGGLVGTNSGAITRTYSASQFPSVLNEYMVFNGGYIAIPRHDVDLTHTFTLEAWFQWDRVRNEENPHANVEFIMGKGPANEYFEFHTEGSSGYWGVRFIPTPHAGSAYYDVRNVLQPAWFHVAAVYSFVPYENQDITPGGVTTVKVFLNGVQQDIYLDGSPTSSGTEITIPRNTVPPLADGPIYIGARADLGSRFTGKITEVRLWNVAREPEDIVQNMNVPSAPHANLAGYWPLNEVTINGDERTTPDLSGRDRTGTLIGTDAQLNAVQSPRSNVGGLVGSNTNITEGAISNSYYDSTRSGLGDTGKGTPLPTADMKIQANYTGWAFGSTWGINPSVNEGYPYLNSSAKDITSLTFATPAMTGTINHNTNTITLTAPSGADVSSLEPSFDHTGASISPTGAQNFVSPVVYTVTAADGSTRGYTVIVNGSGLSASAGETVYVRGGTAVIIDPGLTLTGFVNNINGATVAIRGFQPGSSDLLALTGSHVIGGTWNGTTGILTLSGNRPASDYQAALRSVIFSTTGNAGERIIDFSIGGGLYFAETGHFYEYVAGVLSWTAARDAANNRWLYGRQGYLVTIIREDENAFVASKVQGNGWLGAADVNRDISTGAALSEQTIGNWRWVTGPVADRTQFWQGYGPGTQIEGVFSRWAGGEPNNASGEWVAHMYADGLGYWNDFAPSNSNIQGYIVEYGGMPGDTPLTIQAAKAVTVSKATPTVTSWPSPSGITYGQALSDSTLVGGEASVAGTFAFTTPATEPNAGTYEADVTFTPTDTTNYNSVTGKVDIVVSKATPTVTTWPTTSGITYGQALSSSALSDGVASEAGIFAFTTPATTPNVGTYEADVTFTPTDTANYNIVTGKVDVVISKATPTVSTWPTASGITYGQALSDSTLTGGAASVAGTFAFTTPATEPNAGTYEADVTFTPTETTNYNSVTGKVNIVVSKSTPTVTTWPTASGITYGQALSDSTLTGGAASVAGTFALTTPATTPNTGTYEADVTFTPTDAVNYIAVSGSVNVEVGIQPITVSADSKSKDEGSSDPPLTWRITAGSLVNGDSITGSLTRVSGDAPGTYHIQQGTLTAGPNYDLTYITALFTIRAAESDDAPPDPPVEPPAEEEDETTQYDITFDEKEGVTSIALQSEKSEQQDGTVVNSVTVGPDLAESIAKHKSEGATKVDVIVKPTEEDGKEPVLEVTVATEILAAASGMELSISTPHGSLSIPSALVETLATSGQPLHLVINRQPSADLRGLIPAGTESVGQALSVSTALKGRTQVTILVDVSLPVGEELRQAYLEQVMTFVIHSNGTREMIFDVTHAIEEQTVTGDDGLEYTNYTLKSVSFWVNEFSTFIVVVPNWAVLETTVGSRGYTIAGINRDMAAAYYKGRDTFMPIRMLEDFGVNFAWDEATLTATMTYKGREVILTIGSSYAYINGVKTPIIGASGALLAPELAPGRTMIPLRFVSEHLGFKVAWDPSHLITIRLDDHK
jgi:hypothetical protein